MKEMEEKLARDREKKVNDLTKRPMKRVWTKQDFPPDRVIEAWEYIKAETGEEVLEVEILNQRVSEVTTDKGKYYYQHTPFVDYERVPEKPPWLEKEA